MTVNSLIHTTADVYKALESVSDPEIPVLSVIDLGVVREVRVSGNAVELDITPTYSGCPAMRMIESEIKKVLQESGFTSVKVNTVLSPAWTTDWLTEEGKNKLFAYGIAPPEKTSADKSALFSRGPKKIQCPHCKSFHTELKSQFGSTACKALYICKDCLEPFDYFKCI